MVFTTLSSTGRRIFSRLPAPFETVLVDEAAQASEIAALQALAFGCRRWAGSSSAMHLAAQLSCSACCATCCITGQLSSVEPGRFPFTPYLLGDTVCQSCQGTIIKHACATLHHAETLCVAVGYSAPPLVSESTPQFAEGFLRSCCYSLYRAVQSSAILPCYSDLPC